MKRCPECRRDYYDNTLSLCLDAGLTEKDKALEWLDKAYEYHSFHLTPLNIEPLLDPLHGGPRAGRMDLPTD